MRRGLANLVARLAIALLISPELAAAQTANVPRVGVLANTIPTADLIAGTSTHPAITSLVRGLRDLGWVDGKNLRMVWRSAEGDMKRLPALANELTRERVDLIVAYGQGGEAAMRATDHVPIVLATSGVSGRLIIDGRVRIESPHSQGRQPRLDASRAVAVFLGCSQPADRQRLASRDSGVDSPWSGLRNRVNNPRR